MDKVKTFYINGLKNNHINEYIDRNSEHISDLVSFETRVASYNHTNNIMTVYGYFSKTTAIHINDFLRYYGYNKCNKKQLNNYGKEH